MPFKVVQTTERGKAFLSCVPDKWESNDVLYWPKTKAEKLAKIEKSEPDEDWISIPCKVKRDNLTYDEAQLQINIMSECTDTEEEMPQKHFTSKRSKVQKKTDVSFNHLAEKLMDLKEKVRVRESEESSAVARQTDSEPMQKSLPSTSAINSGASHEAESVVSHIYAEPTAVLQEEPTAVLEEEVAFVDHSVFVVEADEPIPSPPVAVLQDDNCDSYYIVNGTQRKAEDIFSRKLDNLTVAVTELKERQEQILLSLAGISTQIEEFFKRSKMDQLKEKLRFEPIHDLESLQKLENDLKHDAGGELKKKLSVVCGSGKGRGANNCFALIDVMFNRKFLTECSWAGGSRNERKKICFKAFTGIIQLFFSIIHDSDSTFTLLECETFFKNILRNSARRNSAKLLRTSSTKIRKTKKNKNINISNVAAGPSSQEMHQNTPSQTLSSVPPNENQDSSEN